MTRLHRDNHRVDGRGSSIVIAGITITIRVIHCAALMCVVVLARASLLRVTAIEARNSGPPSNAVPGVRRVGMRAQRRVARRVLPRKLAQCGAAKTRQGGGRFCCDLRREQGSVWCCSLAYENQVKKTMPEADFQNHSLPL